MERFKDLGRYQKCLFIGMALMALGFTAAFFVTVSRVGFPYMDAIFVPGQEGDATVYSGRLQWWRQARFTVSADKTVVFECGGKTYGPYTAREDPTAVPKDADGAENMTGVELRAGDEIVFRGGVENSPGLGLLLTNEDGTSATFTVTYTTSDGFTRDENGEIVDPTEPYVGAILELMAGPELVRKGHWSLWLVGVLVCVFNGWSMLFADELFRWGLMFTIRNVDKVEPTDLEIAGRYVSWTALAGLALYLFVMALSL